jgi:hypothetical protein
VQNPRGTRVNEMMSRLLVYLTALIALPACRSDAERDRGPTPTPPPSATGSAPAPRATDALGAMPMRPLAWPAPADLEKHKRDRNADPAFALVKLGAHRYQGRIADACPAGSSVTIAEKGWKIVDGTLEIVLHGGGCPTWTGYTVVAKNPGDLSEPSRKRLPANTLPFYICADRWHDMCEASMWNTWVFDLSTLMTASKTTDVVFAPPTPVDPDPASLCCCVVENKRGDVEPWPSCEVRGGTCDVEAECYGIEGPIPDDDPAP